MKPVFVEAKPRIWFGKCLSTQKINYIEVPNEAAFLRSEDRRAGLECHWPRVSRWPTNQVDFAVPKTLWSCVS